MLPEQQQRIMGYFIEEAKDHLNTIEQGLLSLQSTIEDSEKANELFRAAHSVKGGAAMLGLESIQKTAHRMEDYFKVLKESPVQVDRALETMFLRISDGLKDLLQQLEGPFGLTPDKAQEIMANVEPVFDQLEAHLNVLVERTDAIGSSRGRTASTTGAVVTSFSAEALQASFKRDVALLLRQMLTTFKQPDTADTRQTIQSVCAQMKVIGKQFELSGWCDLVETARMAAAHLGNDYRVLAPILIREIKAAQDLVLLGRDSEVAVCEALQALLPEDVLNPDLAGVGFADVVDGGRSAEGSSEGSFDDEFDDIGAALDEVDHAEVPDGLEDLFLENALPLDGPDGLSEPDDLEASDDFGDLFEDSLFESSSESLAGQIDGDAIDGNERLDELESDDIGRLSLDLDFDEIPSELSTLNRYAGSEDKADESLDALLATVNVTGPDVGTEELNSLADLFDGDLDELDNTLGGHAFISEEMRLNPEKIDLAAADDLTDLLANEVLDDEPLDAIAPAPGTEDDLFGGTLTDGGFATEADLEDDLAGDETSEGTSDDMELLSEDVWAQATEATETSEDNLSADVWADLDSDRDDDLFEVDSLFEAAENSASALQSELGFDELGVDHEVSSDLLNPDDLKLDDLKLDDLKLDDLKLDESDHPNSDLEKTGLNDLENSLVEDEDASRNLWESEPPVVEQVLKVDGPPYPSTVLSPAVPASPREVEIEFPTLTGIKLQAAEDDIDSFFLDSQTDRSFAPSDDAAAELVLEDFEDERSTSETDDDSYSVAAQEDGLTTAEIPDASDVSIVSIADVSIVSIADVSTADDDLWGEFSTTSPESSADSDFVEGSENALEALFDETTVFGNENLEGEEENLEGDEENLEGDEDVKDDLESNVFNLSAEDPLLFDEDLNGDFLAETTSSDPFEAYPSDEVAQSDEVNQIDDSLDDLFELSFESLEESLEENLEESTEAGNQSNEADLLVADSFVENDLVNDDLAASSAAGDSLNSDFDTDFDGDLEDDFEGDSVLNDLDLDDLLDFTLQDSEADVVEPSATFSSEIETPSEIETDEIDETSEPIQRNALDHEQGLENDGLENDGLDNDGLDNGLDDEFDDLDLLLADDLLSAEEPFSADEPTDDFDDAPTFTPAASSTAIAQRSSVSASNEDFGDLERLLEDGASESFTSTSVRRVPQRAVRRSGGGVREQNMRVSVSHLDTLSNLVGELVVSRNTLERDQERLRQFLDNLLFQVQQLNDVGQRMRDLYERSLLESSLLSNRRAHALGGSRSAPVVVDHHATGATFDALEMDKFTGFHTLSQEMIELIVRVRESASDIGYTVESSDQVTRQFRQITTQLQEGLNTARMVAFSQAADRLPRAVRDISLKCGKEARLIIEGQDTLIDKMVVENLYDPLTHLVNNAITHGIESPAARSAAGKPTEGAITVRAFYQGNQMVIYVADDGGGIDTNFVKQKAIEKSLISKAEADLLSDIETYELLFHPGFSTRDQADDFAGRGVGMDVVRTSLAEIRGSVTIDSEMGKGTSFTIRLPLTLSISKALSCVSNQARIAFPMDGVEDMLNVPRDRIVKDNQGQNCVRWRDKLLPFQPVTDLLKFNRTIGRGRVYGGSQDDDVLSIIVLRNANTFVALQVDQVIGEQEIVIKQLEGPVPKPQGISGATVLGDGRVMPIADVLELIDIAMGRIRRGPSSQLWAKAAAAIEEAPVKSDPTVLIVDDSITVRELLSMSFNKVGYRVEQARDGQEAWDKLRSGLPCDLVFCDIEMPRMDGLELLSRMQKDNHLNRIPIAMLTSRGADRHRQMAIDLGASGYFTKPYLEEALLDAAQRMLNGETLAKGRGG